MRKVLLASCFALVACSPEPAMVPAAPPAAPAASDALPVAPMQLVLQGKNGANHVVSLRADGSIGTPEAPLLGRIVGNTLQGAGGRTLLTMQPDGTVVLDGGRAMRFGAQGELIGEMGTIAVRDDGSVSITDAAGKPLPAAGRIEGMTAHGRRTGAVLVAFALSVGQPAPPPPDVQRGVGGQR
jgi:hypothetical protein